MGVVRDAMTGCLFFEVLRVLTKHKNAKISRKSERFKG